jgi:hypothetical protein
MIQWSDHAGGDQLDGGGYVSSDNNGNTYVAGITQSSLCFFDNDTIHQSLFIAKYNSSGDRIWLLSFINGTGSLDGEGGNIPLTLDTIRQNLLVSGTFFGFLMLPNDSILLGSKNTIFLMKIDLDGHIKWTKTAGGVGDDQAFGITYDATGNIFISGSNSDSANFDNIIIPRGGFIAKYDSGGNVLWAKHKFRYFTQFGDGYPFDEVNSKKILINQNSLLIFGDVLRDTVVVDTVTFKNPPGFMSTFISSFTLSGDLKWMKCAGGPFGASGDFTTDRLGNIYISGLLTGKGIFGTDTLVQPGNLGDAFLAKYDLNGDLHWATNLKCTEFAWGWAVATDTGGSVYFSGQFHGNAYFGNTLISSMYSGNNMFLARYTSSGNNIGVVQFGEGGIYGLATDNEHNVCFTGDFLDTLVLGRNTYPSYGYLDFFVAKCSPITNGIEATSEKDDKLLIYANPTTGICNIEIPVSFQNEKELTLFVYNATGNLMQKITINIINDKITFDIQAQAKGIYPVILTNGIRSYSGKIIFE